MTIFFIVLAVLLVGTDQLIKWWAASTLPGNSIDLIPGVFSFTYAENTGAAFSMFENGRIFFIVITVLLISGAVFALVKRYFKGRWAELALFLVISGGIGNLIDRIFRGYVIDYLYFELINFPIFNLADSCVVVGAAILALVILLEKKPEEKSGDRLEQASSLGVLNEAAPDEVHEEAGEEAQDGEDDTPEDEEEKD